MDISISPKRLTRNNILTQPVMSNIIKYTTPETTVNLSRANKYLYSLSKSKLNKDKQIYILIDYLIYLLNKYVTINIKYNNKNYEIYPVSGFFGYGKPKNIILTNEITKHSENINLDILKKRLILLFNNVPNIKIQLLNVPIDNDIDAIKNINKIDDEFTLQKWINNNKINNLFEFIDSLHTRITKKDITDIFSSFFTS